MIFIGDKIAGFISKNAGKPFGVFQRLRSPGALEGAHPGLTNVRRIFHLRSRRAWAEGVVARCLLNKHLQIQVNGRIV